MGFPDGLSKRKNKDQPAYLDNLPLLRNNPSLLDDKGGLSVRYAVKIIP